MRRRFAVKQPSDLPQVVQEVSPQRFGFGSLVTVLMPLHTRLFFSTGSQGLDSSLTVLDSRSSQAKWAGTTEPHFWLEKTVCSLVVAQSTRYAYACRRDELPRSQISFQMTLGLAQLVGSLGRPCLASTGLELRMGRNALLLCSDSAFRSLSSEICFRVGEGFLVRLNQDPSLCGKMYFAEARSHCLRTLGPNFFFDRNLRPDMSGGQCLCSSLNCDILGLTPRSSGPPPAAGGVR